MFEFQYCGVQNSHTLKWLKASNCVPQVINDIERTMTVGCLNKMNASSSHANFMEFFRYGNHTSIEKDLDKTMKTMNKEDNG